MRSSAPTPTRRLRWTMQERASAALDHASFAMAKEASALTRLERPGLVQSGRVRSMRWALASLHEAVARLCERCSSSVDLIGAVGRRRYVACYTNPGRSNQSRDRLGQRRAPAVGFELGTAAELAPIAGPRGLAPARRRRRVVGVPCRLWRRTHAPAPRPSWRDRSWAMS